MIVYLLVCRGFHCRGLQSLCGSPGEWHAAKGAVSPAGPCPPPTALALDGSWHLRSACFGRRVSVSPRVFPAPNARPPPRWCRCEQRGCGRGLWPWRPGRSPAREQGACLSPCDSSHGNRLGLWPVHVSVFQFSTMCPMHSNWGVDAGQSRTEIWRPGRRVVSLAKCFYFTEISLASFGGVMEHCLWIRGFLHCYLFDLLECLLRVPGEKP